MCSRRKKSRHRTTHYLFNKQCGLCFYCGVNCILDCAGTQSDNPIVATLDHVFQRCHGGTYERSNLVLACRTCNNQRGHMHFADFFFKTSIKVQDFGRLRQMKKHVIPIFSDLDTPSAVS